MIKTIEEQIKRLGIEIKGSLNIEIEEFDDNKVKVFDMNIMTFEKKLVAVYYKKINTTFRAETIERN